MKVDDFQNQVEAGADLTCEVRLFSALPSAMKVDDFQRLKPVLILRFVFSVLCRLQ